MGGRHVTRANGTQPFILPSIWFPPYIWNSGEFLVHFTFPPTEFSKSPPPHVSPNMLWERLMLPSTRLEFNDAESSLTIVLFVNFIFPPIWDLETPKLDMPVAFILPPTVELPTYTSPMSEFMFPATVAPASSNTIVPLDLTFPATMVVKSRPRTPSFLMSPLTVVPYRPQPP